MQTLVSEKVSHCIACILSFIAGSPPLLAGHLFPQDEFVR